MTMENVGNEVAQHHEAGQQAVLFVFVGLLFGSLLREINKKTKVPYTPMLLVLGIFMGYFRSYFGVVGSSIEIIKDMNPHLILFIFIPILIFQSAYNCDWYVFRKSLLNILLLAGPGVLWGAVIIAFIFKWILNYEDSDLSWYEALTLGSILSATDPVAVVALLKDLGASVRFNTLVEGQSLLNDGTAMVFFMLFMGLAKGEGSSPLGVLSNFVRVSLGGPLLGLAVGFVMSWWMKRIVQDSVLSVNITFIGAFLCFYLAEFTWIKVSGILSIVVLGLYFSAVGKRKIYPESQHAVHNVWASIQFGSETLIFLLTGIVVGVKMIEQTTITASDWICMILFWVLMILARGIMVMTFYPFLVRSGYRINKKQIVILIYGGLRGALGLCLSLLVGVDQSLPIRFRELTVFYMCGMAMMTIIINGLTCRKLVDYLEMIVVPEIKETLLKRCIKQVLLKTQQKLKELKSETTLSYAKWKDVEKRADVKQLGLTFHERQSQIQTRDSFKKYEREDITEEIRFRFTRYLNKVYWEFYENGELSEESVRVLAESCNIANDEIHLKLRYFEIISSFFTMDTMGVYMRFKDAPVLGKLIVHSIIQKVYFAYEISLAFVEACEEVVHQFEAGFPMHEQHMRYVLDEVKENVENSLAYISQLENNYPKMIQAVHTERATSILLKSKKKNLKIMHEEGFVDDKDYAQLRQQIDISLLRNRQADYRLQEVKFSQVLTQCPLFANLATNQMVNIRKKSREMQYDKNTKLVFKNQFFEAITIIISGSVKQEFENFYLIRSIGNILNPYDATYKQKSKCTAKTRNNVKVLQIEEGVIEQIFNQNKQFKKHWYKSLIIYCVHHEKELSFLLKKFSEKQLRRFIEASEIVLMEVNQKKQISEGAYVMIGEIENQQRKMLTKGNYVEKKSSLKALVLSIIVNFKAINGGVQAEDRMSVLSRS